MSKLLTTLIAAVFAVTTTGVFAQTPAKDAPKAEMSKTEKPKAKKATKAKSTKAKAPKKGTTK